MNDLNKKHPEKHVKVVKYKGDYYVWYKTTSDGYAQLIDARGNKFSGTPSPANLELKQVIYCKEFNKHWYFSTKIGCFSMSTGDKITHPEILKMFDETASLLDEINQIMSTFDWTYPMSDDGSAWRRGEAKRQQLLTKCKEAGLSQEQVYALQRKYYGNNLGGCCSLTYK